jgi:hypothetical protein
VTQNNSAEQQKSSAALCIKSASSSTMMDLSSTRPAFVFLRPRPTAPHRLLPLLLDDDVVVCPDHDLEPAPPVFQQQQMDELTPADTAFLVVEADLPGYLYVPVLQETSGTLSSPRTMHLPQLPQIRNKCWSSSFVFPALKRHRDHLDDPEAELPARHNRLSQPSVGTDARPFLDDNEHDRGEDLSGSWPAGCYHTPKCQRNQAVDGISSPPRLVPRVVTPTHYELPDNQLEDDRARASTTTTTGRRRFNLPLLPTSS